MTNAAGFLLLILPWFPRQFPLVRQIKPNIRLLPQLVAVSLALFLAAHALLFRLHLPSRYTGHSFRMVMSLAGAIALIILIDSAWRFWQPRWAVAVTGLMAAGVLFYPLFVEDFPITSYKVGTAGPLYEFFQKQPTDSLIASLSDEADNLPSFAARSILVGREYAIPYHLGYYREFQKRVSEQLIAQYSSNPADLESFIHKYNVDFWLLRPQELTLDFLAGDRWLQQYGSAAQTAQTGLKNGNLPALQQKITDCLVFQFQDLVVLEANCTAQPVEK
ncbi:MAG: hypothetical protein HC890_01940 [Chloroflexaceae bacterium]|nr:hypothetical protein [Chloroflexaceae bacterium]